MLCACAFVMALLPAVAHAGPQADVVHWWTSPGETAAMHPLADAYRAAGGQWRDHDAAALRDAGRLPGNTEMLLAPEQLTALERAVSDFWNRDIPIQTAQQTLAKILQDRRQP